jgi:hypothetical protein
MLLLHRGKHCVKAVKVQLPRHFTFENRQDLFRPQGFAIWAVFRECALEDLKSAQHPRGTPMDSVHIDAQDLFAAELLECGCCFSMPNLGLMQKFFELGFLAQ